MGFLKPSLLPVPPLMVVGWVALPAGGPDGRNTMELANVTTEEGVRVHVRQAADGTLIVDVDTDDVPNDDAAVIICMNDAILVDTVGL